MTKISIADSIPHRDAMLLIDQVTEFSENQITCVKLFRADEFFFEGHYPDSPLVPGVILCECAAQSSAVLLANRLNAGGDKPGQADNSMADKVPVLARMNKVRFRETVFPGDTIEIQVKLVETVSAAYFLSAVIRKNGKTAASLELTCTMVPRSIVEKPG